MARKLIKEYWYLILMALIFGLAPSARAETRVVLGLTGVLSNFEQEITSTGATGETDAKLSVGATLFLEAQLNNWFGIDTVLQFSQRTSEATGTLDFGTGTTSSVTVEFKHNYLEIMVVPRIYLVKDFSIGVGPYYAPSGTDGLEDDLGVVGSARVGLSDKIILEGRYLFGINDVDNLNGVKTKYRTINIVLGYRF